MSYKNSKILHSVIYTLVLVLLCMLVNIAMNYLYPSEDTFFLRAILCGIILAMMQRLLIYKIWKYK